MQLLKSVIFGLSAFAAHAAAQGNLAFTSTPGSVQAGQPVTITYTGGNGPATIILREGDPGNLNTIATLTTSATGGTYTWTPSTSLPSGSRYALEIQQGGQINYSGQIALSGGSNAPLPSSVISSASALISSASSAISSAQSSASSESVSSVISSISSAVSSELSSAFTSILASVNSSITANTIVGTVGTTGATIPMSRNTTLVSPTLSSSTTTDTSTSTATTRATRTTGTTGTQTGTSTATGTGAPNANAAAGLSSPLALVLGAVAAMIYLN